MHTTEFQGKRALVTGGTKGIGYAIVQRLRRGGATVLTTARSIPDELPTPEMFAQADLSNPNGAAKVVQAPWNASMASTSHQQRGQLGVLPRGCTFA